MTSSPRSYISRHTVNRDENEVKNSAKMCHACEARDVVNLFGGKSSEWSLLHAIRCEWELLWVQDETSGWSPISSALIGPSLHIRGEGNGF